MARPRVRGLQAAHREPIRAAAGVQGGENAEALVLGLRREARGREPRRNVTDKSARAGPFSAVRLALVIDSMASEQRALVVPLLSGDTPPSTQAILKPAPTDSAPKKETKKDVKSPAKQRPAPHVVQSPARALVGSPLKRLSSLRLINDSGRSP